MKVRFLADADLNKTIVSGVVRREPSIDFLTAQTAGLGRMTDIEVLAVAAEQQRVLVIGIAIEELVVVWLASEAEEWQDRLVWLPL